MIENTATGIALVVFVGIAAQWLGWRLRIPSILLLLVAGLVVGPVTDAIDPEDLFGETLFPIVSLSVAVILFEGGMSLKFDELRHSGSAVIGLVSIGVLVTWGLAALIGWAILDLGFELSLLLGSILTVTGPTVIGPILRHIRPIGPGGLALKWEGILVDPIGALLAVLVFSAVLSGELESSGYDAVLALLRSLGIGVSLGLAGAGATILLIYRYWTPDFLHEVTTLAIVVGVFALSNELASESGLIAVTVMGVAIANQKIAVVKHIAEFKENLRVVLVSVLFIVLAARVDLDQLRSIGWEVALFVGLLIFVVRPLSVIASTAWTRLDWKNMTFVSAMAPRGIVAAAISADFSLRLAEVGETRAETLVPIMFSVIAGTVIVYSFTGSISARLLGLAQGTAEGVLILGAHETGRGLAEALKNKGVLVSIIDTNRAAVTKARTLGFDAKYVSVLSDDLLDEIDLNGVGSLVAMSPNDELNSLACTHFSEILGRNKVYQLTPDQPAAGIDYAYPSDTRGQILFEEDITFRELETLRGSGWRLRTTRLTDEYTYDDYLDHNHESTIPMVLIRGSGDVNVISADLKLSPRSGDSVIAITAGQG